MKRAIISALVLVCFAAMGCPPKTDTDLTVYQATEIMDMALAEHGINSRTSVQDVDGNGRIDYYLVVSGEPANMDELRLATIQGGVTGAIREIQRSTSWKAELAFLEVGGHLYRASIDELYACDGMPEQDGGYCILDAWKLVSAPGYGMIGGPARENAGS